MTNTTSRMTRVHPPKKILLSETPRFGFGKKPEPEPHHKQAGPRHCTVLIVDDEASVLTLTNTVVSRMGHGTKTAKNGHEALELFKLGGIDLIISDYDMPKMDGGRLLIEAKKIDPKVRFICQTGRPDNKREITLMEHGALFILHKPYSPAELRSVVNYALSNLPESK